MNAVTHIEADELAALLRRFGLGTLERFELAANGIENSNYFVAVRHNASCKDYVLTVLEQPSTAGRRAYVDLIDNAVRGGLPVPAIMRRTDDQKAFDTLYGKPALVSRRLRGQHVVNPTRDQIAAIGRFLARFHLGTGHLSSYLPAYPRNESWISAQRAAIEPWTSFPDREITRFAADAVCSLLKRRDTQALPQSVIHGDLFRDNALFNDLGLSGVLDFHHAATGYCLFDLAVVANDWCTDVGGALNRDRCTVLLRSYHQQRSLTAQECWLFSTFTLYAGLVFYLSRARALVPRPDGAPRPRAKNPREFLNLVRERLARPITIDPRRLR